MNKQNYLIIECTLLMSKDSFTEFGGWTVDVGMACPANTVLAAFQGIRQLMM